MGVATSRTPRLTVKSFHMTESASWSSDVDRATGGSGFGCFVLAWAYVEGVNIDSVTGAVTPLPPGQVVGERVANLVGPDLAACLGVGHV